MNQSAVRTEMREGKVAVFINGWNVWDLAPEELTRDVRSAILRGYEMGRKHRDNEIQQALRSSDNSFDIDVDIILPKEAEKGAKHGRKRKDKAKGKAGSRH